MHFILNRSANFIGKKKKSHQALYILKLCAGYNAAFRTVAFSLDNVLSGVGIMVYGVVDGGYYGRAG